MISRNDLYLLLAELKDSGIDTEAPTKELVDSRKGVPVSVLKFINDHRQMDLSRFYEKLRKSYNDKHSKLYGSIVKEESDPQFIITTLSCLLTQVVLFSRDVEDRDMFLKHARAAEISKVLLNHFQLADVLNAQKLLRLIKADLKCLEGLK